jgi:hypothetical protein
MEQSSNSIVKQIRFDKKRVLLANLRVWMALALDVPVIFSGTVEIAETYLGGAWKNRRKVVRDTGTRRGRGGLATTGVRHSLSEWSGMGRGCPECR